MWSPPCCCSPGHTFRIKQVPRTTGPASHLDLEMRPHRRMRSTCNKALSEVRDGMARVREQAQWQLAPQPPSRVRAPVAPSYADWGAGSGLELEEAEAAKWTGCCGTAPGPAEGPAHLSNPGKRSEARPAPLPSASLPTIARAPGDPK